LCQVSLFNSYCPEEDIVPPFAPAPAAPGVFPLPEVPVFRQEPVPVPHEEYGPPEVPHEEYGPPEIPHEEYGIPEYIPELAPFVPAPPAPEPFPLPVPEVPFIPEVVVTDAPIFVPEIPHEEYGPPTPFVPTPPAPPLIEAPYPAPLPVTTVPPPPPPPPVRIAPYPAPTEAPTTTTAVPYVAPYVPPVPVTTTTTTVAPARSAPYPYPAKQISHYGDDTSHSSGGSSLTGGDSGSGIIVPAVKAPIAPVVPAKSYVKYVKPHIVISKKVIGFPVLPQLFLKKRSILSKLFHH
jgi:hypothetical protein